MVSATPTTRSLEFPEHVVLTGISWATYLALLADTGEHRTARFAYANGILEITMPYGLHELINRLLDDMVKILAEEMNLAIQIYGSTTYNRASFGQGLEADSCYYIQNLLDPSRCALNLPLDMPPDLAIEVDFTSSSKHKMSIYQTLDVPELWQYTPSQGVLFYELHNGNYQEIECSSTFPIATGVILTQYINRLATESNHLAIRQDFRQWVKQTLTL